MLRHNFKINIVKCQLVIFWNSKKNIGVIGDKGQAGSYTLLIHLEKEKTVKFGRFKHGKQIHLKSGYYIYIGSALHPNGATSLGNRLKRHSKRSLDNQPHQIQSELLTFFDSIGIRYTNSKTLKKMYWNIDHLLDFLDAEIIGVIFTRNPQALENRWSEYFENKSETSIFEKGIGANDSKGHTHIQFVDPNNFFDSKNKNKKQIIPWWNQVGEELTIPN